MRPVKIITDSCADIGKDLREKYDIDYARMQTTYNDKEQWASLDFEYYTPKELYDIMRNGERVFTNQVPAEEFEKIFSNYLTDGFNSWTKHLTAFTQRPLGMKTGKLNLAILKKEKFSIGI